MSSYQFRSALLAMILGATLVACDGAGGASGGSSARLGVDGETSAWDTQAGDAAFRKHGVATGLTLRAKDGARSVELTGTFLGEPAEPVFVALGVSYDDGQGLVFERAAPLDPEGQGAEGVTWERISLDHEAGEGRAEVTLDIPVCADHYTGPTEFETRCHQLEGRFDVALVRDATLRIMQ